MVRFEVSFEDQGAVVTIDGTAVVVPRPSNVTGSLSATSSSLNYGSSRGTIRTMNPRPGFICVVVDNMARSLTFYEHLGFKFPPEAYGEIHVELELPGGLQIYWDLTQWANRYAPDYLPAPHGRVALGFQVDSAGDVDALFTKLKGLGHKVDRTPWDAPWGVRYAIVYDPDGNLIEIYSPRPLGAPTP